MERNQQKKVKKVMEEKVVMEKEKEVDVVKNVVNKIIIPSMIGGKKIISISVLDNGLYQIKDIEGTNYVIPYDQYKTLS